MIDNSEKGNIAGLLERNLSRDILNIICKIGKLAEDNDFSAYVVGGFVRDLILGIKNLDLDIVVEGNALSFVNLLKKKIDLKALIHRRFGTASVTLSDGFKIDIASARREHYAHAASLPSVRLSSIKDDLSRRDFTINTLAIKINRDNFGQLLDFFRGYKDLKEGKIRVLHDRSFVDDPTRIFRAIRFEQRFNFSIEKHTSDLIKEAKKAKMLEHLSKFRVGGEIILILKEEVPLKSLLRLSKLCGLGFIHPLIRLNKTMMKYFKSAQKVVYSFKRKISNSDSWLIYFIILTSPLSLKELKKLCRDFSLTKRDTQIIEHYKKSENSAMKKLRKTEFLFAHQIYQMLSPFSYEEIIVLLVKARNFRAKNRIRTYLNRLSGVKIKLTGRDLKRLKLKPGPQYKDILQEVLFAKVDGKLRSKSDELNYVKRLLKDF